MTTLTFLHILSSDGEEHYFIAPNVIGGGEDLNVYIMQRLPEQATPLTYEIKHLQYYTVSPI